MKDVIIDSVLVVLCMSFIIAVIKFGVAGFRMVGATIKKWINDRRYPVKSSVIPFKVLKFGDSLEIDGAGICKYQGKHDGKYYIETLDGSKPFSGDSYKYVDQEFLKKHCILLQGTVVKWRKGSITKGC